MAEGGGATRDPETRRGYAWAWAATLVALAGRVALDPLLGTRHRFALLYAAIIVVAARYGLGPGMAVVLAGGVGVTVLAGLPSLSSVTVLGLFTLDVGFYVATGAAIAWVAASMRRARRAADVNAAAAARHTAALAESEERYRSFIHRSSEGIWRIELRHPISVELPEEEQIAAFYRDAHLAECNDTMARMYGFADARALIGARLDQLLVPTDPANREYLLAFIRGGYRVSDAESHERDRHGEDKYFLNTLVGVVERGQVVRAWGTQRDVTESRRTERALRASQERLRLALDAGQMGIWDWNMRTGAVEWTHNLEGLAGLAPGTVTTTYEAFVALVHPDDRASFGARAQAAIAEEGTFEAEFRVMATDGGERWMLGKGQVFSDDDGIPVRMVGIAIDVTARKRVEEELRTSVARLEHAESEVQQLYVLEREARADAERSNRAKDEFLATLSHELRSPLSAALSWTHMLRRGQLDAEKTARALETIERTTRLQVRLIEDLLDISRIVSGKLTLEMGVVDVRTVIESAVAAAHATADARHVTLTAEPPREVLLVPGDALRVEQIIGNLLGNAIKFTAAGGAVAVAWRRDGGEVEITVRDSGAGIAPDVLPHIFDRFRQADSSTTRRHGGLGLGLAIVRHLVELHGGTIVAESAGAGRGTVMRVRLPLEMASERALGAGAADGAEDAAAASALAGCAVLVVDDEADIREMLRATLALGGARVTTAGSVDEGLARIRSDRPDVIVSDLAMPDRDGYELLRKLRAGGGVMPVVALTALASAADRKRALTAGFDAYLVKPVEPPFLIATVARVCADVRAMRASDAASLAARGPLR